MVMESKVEGWSINTAHLKKDVFLPLRDLFPKAHLKYILFGQENKIYNIPPVLSSRSITIHDALAKENIGTLLLSFNEKRGDFAKMRSHLIKQHRELRNNKRATRGKVAYTDNEIIVYSQERMQLVHLLKDGEGLWKEVEKR